MKLSALGESNANRIDKINYRTPPHASEIKGLDLCIDVHTQKLCETYNQSSGTTRSVLYVLMIINIIAVIAAFNSNAKYNWTSERISKHLQAIVRLQRQLAVIKAENNSHGAISNADTMKIKDSIDFHLKNEASLIQSSVSDYGIVRVNIIGVNFDIYDMPSIVGMSIIVLMIVLRFTLTREMQNLRIAFNSITERYPDDADRKIFQEYLHTKLKPAKSGEMPMPENIDSDPILTDINFVRRRYHYNFLSMNEVFNVPYLDTSNNKLQTKFLGVAINMHLFYFCILIYSYVMFNFFCNIPSVGFVGARHSWVIGTICVICYIIVANLSRACSDQKVAIARIFKDFWSANYTYDHTKEYRREYSVANKIFVPLIFLAALYGFSIIFVKWL